MAAGWAYQICRLVSCAAILAVAWQLFVLASGHKQLLLYAYDEAKTELAVAAAERQIIESGLIEPQMTQALDRGDLELAESYAALADAHGIELRNDLAERLETLNSPLQTWPRTIRQFTSGFLFGDHESLMAMSGAVASDFLVIGDLRDLGQAGLAYANDEPVDEVLVLLSATGVALSAGTLASLGTATPVKAGAASLKWLWRSGRLTASFASDLSKLVQRTFPEPARIGLVGDLLNIRPFAGQTSLLTKAASRVKDRADPHHWQQLTNIAGQWATLQKTTSLKGLTAAAKHIEKPQDLATLARLTPQLGNHFLAVEKALGKGVLKLAKTSLKLTAALWLELTKLAAAIATSLAAMAGQSFCKRSIKATFAPTA